MPNPWLSCGIAIATAAAFTGCGGSQKIGGSTKGLAASSENGTVQVPKVDPTLCSTQGKTVETFDLNHDGKPDVWKLHEKIDQGGTTVDVITCKQVDFDHDGRKDYVAIYNRKGALIAEEFDLTFNGHFDVRIHYDPKTGKKYLEERDTDFDNKPDVWEKYDKNGKLVSVERDRNGDGKPDEWEQYKDGKLIAILYDDDYDGRVDRKEEVPGADNPEASAKASTGKAGGGAKDSTATTKPAGGN